MPLEVQIFPYKTREGQVVEWHLCLIDPERSHGDRIVDTQRVVGNYADALDASALLAKKTSKKRKWGYR